MTLTGNPTLADSGFDNPPSNPLLLLDKWLKSADHLGVREPRGFVLCTVNQALQPSSRVVLLKGSDEQGIIFTTSSESGKGKDLKANPQAAGTLWWRETIQQINFSGKVVELPPEIADKIFQERTREAQAVTALSKQSAPLFDEKKLRDDILTLVNTKDPIKRPPGWLAYHLIVEFIEFCQGDKSRFHQRLRYQLKQGSWHHQLVQP